MDDQPHLKQCMTMIISMKIICILSVGLTIGLGLLSNAYAEPYNNKPISKLLTETHLQLNPQQQLKSQQVQIDPEPTSLSEHIGQPFIVYIWERSCAHCIQTIKQLNQFSQQNQVTRFSLLLENTQNSASFLPEALLPENVLPQNTLPPEIRKIPNELTNVIHLYNPYLSGAQINATSLPEIRVYNKFGNIAARYPNFSTSSWGEIAALIKQLNTHNFARYAMSNPNQHPANASTKATGNIFELHKINSTLQTQVATQTTTLNPLAATHQLGAKSRSDYIPSHSIALATPSAHISTTLNAGQDIGPNWNGIETYVVQELSLDQRLHFSANRWNANSYENQPMAPGTASPQDKNLMIGYESYTGQVRYGLSLLQRSLAFRDDMGFHIEVDHLFWNQRTSLQFGASLFNASHDATTTVNAAAEDENRLHQVHLSHIINAQNRFTFSWFNDALQGIIENPNELVHFRLNTGSSTGIGLQYALYPTTRTQNNYVIQWHQPTRTYGYSFYDDTWGIEQHQLFATVTHHVNSWQLIGKTILTHQVDAKFFSDLYPAQDAQSLLSRSPHQAGFDSAKFILQGETPVNMKLWDKPTFVTVKGSLEHIRFEALSEQKGLTRQPVTSLILSTSVGLKLLL